LLTLRLTLTQTPTSPRELFGILKEVSRSFYISVRFLPGRIRRTVAIAYLLARASDTIADTNSLEASARIGFLADFLACVRETRRHRHPDIAPFLAGQGEGPEKKLLLHVSQIIRQLESIPGRHRQLVVEVLSNIIQGQTLDIERFETVPGLHALPDSRSLEEYTWFVAGCVGEFWTKLCLLEWTGYSRAFLSSAKLLRLGRQFGQGLQLINILRDFPSDIQRGRCYLPVDNVAQVAADPNLVRPQWEHWHRKALCRLESGWQYIDAIRPPRIRFACAVPLFIGVRTLTLLAEGSTLRSGMKIPRSEVKILMVWAALLAWLPFSKAWICPRIFGR
jgi:farnesyl-diphosphate farnesyltransferase